MRSEWLALEDALKDGKEHDVEIWFQRKNGRGRQRMWIDGRLVIGTPLGWIRDAVRRFLMRYGETA